MIENSASSDSVGIEVSMLVGFRGNLPNESYVSTPATVGMTVAAVMHSARAKNYLRDTSACRLIMTFLTVT